MIVAYLFFFFKFDKKHNLCHDELLVISPLACSFILCNCVFVLWLCMLDQVKSVCKSSHICIQNTGKSILTSLLYWGTSVIEFASSKPNYSYYMHLDIVAFTWWLEFQFCLEFKHLVILRSSKLVTLSVISIIKLLKIMDLSCFCRQHKQAYNCCKYNANGLSLHKFFLKNLLNSWNE